MMEIVTGVAIALIVAAILASVKWLSDEDNRERVRQLFCRHDWEPLEMQGPGFIRITPDSYECPKCGARK